MKLDDNCFPLLVVDELVQLVPVCPVFLTITYLSEEPRDEIAKDNSLVGLGITWRRGDATNRPQIAFPLVQIIVCGACVKEKDSRCSVDQPTAIKGLDSSIVH